MTSSRSRQAVALVTLALVAAVPAFAQKRGITEKDLFTFVWVADPQISPDGWRLAFVRSVEKDERTQPSQVFVMSMDGGEARAITEMPRGAGNPQWSPDGKRIAFSSNANAEDIRKAEDEKKKKEATPDADDKSQKPGAEDEKDAADKPRESDVRVITRAVYRANGVADFGYVDPDRPSHIWTVEVPDPAAPLPTPTQVTSGEFAENNFQWSPDGSRIFFVSNRVKESYYFPNDSDLYSIAAGGGPGDPVKVASIDGTISDYAFAPDGKRIAFVGTLHGSPVRSHSQADLWVMDPGAGAPRNLTAAYDFDIDGGLGGDQRAPRGGAPSGPVWSRDGRTLLVKVGEQGDANIKRVDVASGKIEPLTTGHHDVMAYTADAAGQTLALILSDQMVLGDLQLYDTASRSMKKLTTFNDELFDELTLSEPEEIWYGSFDGKKIQGWILKPPGFDASKKYPLILQIHGGPHSAYGNTFTHEFQWMAAKGYVVLFTNPRGSSNYGQEFGNIIQYNYPGDDFKDLMAGVDEVVKKGYVDEKRLGVTGGSGGGILTNWVVTHTTRFAAAVAQRDISDWNNFWYTADFWLYNPTWFRKAPFQDPAEFAQRSPITYVEKVQTPLMFILGDEDWRTPTSAGGEQMFRALKFLKKPTVMVRFPDENHELSRSGKPWHRVERLQHIVGWMDKYLMGKNTGTYTYE